MDSQIVHQLAVRGARIRLQEIEQERAALLRLVGEADSAPARVPTKRRRPRVVTNAAPAPKRSVSAPRKRRMSMAARQAVSKRMKAYWAAQRKAKAAA